VVIGKFATNSFHHSLNMSLHYLVKYECQETGDFLKIFIEINDKSQDSTAKHLSFDGFFSLQIYHSVCW